VKHDKLHLHYGPSIPEKQLYIHKIVYTFAFIVHCVNLRPISVWNISLQKINQHGNRLLL